MRGGPYIVEGWEIQAAVSIVFIIFISFLIFKIKSSKEKLVFERGEERQAFYKRRINALMVGILLASIAYIFVFLLA